MIVTNNKTFPTQFAILVAQQHELFVPPEYEAGNEVLWHELKDRLANFQKMAMSAAYDDCLIAYYGCEINEEQKEVLKFIYEKTKVWLMGHVAESIFDKLQKPTTTGKDARELAELLSNNFLGVNGNVQKMEPQQKRSAIIKFANLPPGTEISDDFLMEDADDEDQ